jgi:hypothetical protein
MNPSARPSAIEYENGMLFADHASPHHFNVLVRPKYLRSTRLRQRNSGNDYDDERFHNPAA